MLKSEKASKCFVQDCKGPGDGKKMDAYQSIMKIQGRGEIRFSINFCYSWLRCTLGEHSSEQAIFFHFPYTFLTFTTKVAFLIYSTF